MDPALSAGIIGGICTIAAVIITPIAQKYFETIDFFPIDSDRRKTLQGIWKGFVKQYFEDGTFRTLNVELTLKIKGKKINGTGIINTTELYHVSLDGSFRSDRFLKMDYQNIDPNIVQFGCFVFHLYDDSPKLTGRFVGYGPISKTIIYGECEFKKA